MGSYSSRDFHPSLNLYNAGRTGIHRMTQAIYAIATLNTKGPELAFLAREIRAAGQPVRLCDVSTGLAAPSAEPCDYDRTTIAARHPQGGDAVLQQTDRGQAVTAMSVALERFLLDECAAGRVSAVIGIGGGGGTALVTRAMRALPIGLPKLMVSTMASGNTQPYVDTSDITMMYSVADIAGLNRVTRQILANAAWAIAGMARAPKTPADSRPALGLTMFGVTTPCVTAAAAALGAAGYDCLVFHATGTGGRAMEKLVASDMIAGVLDLTTTEVADEVVGGVLPAGPSRFEIIIEKRIPYLMSVGALDMVNFGPMASVPEKFRNRRLHVHNAQITLMRTTPDECRAIARWITGKVNRSTAPFTLLISTRGVSAIDAPGQPFEDAQADAALFDELEAAIIQTPLRRVIRLDHHINDPAFAAAAVEHFTRLVRQNKSAAPQP